MYVYICNIHKMYRYNSHYQQFKKNKIRINSSQASHPCGPLSGASCALRSKADFFSNLTMGVPIGSLDFCL